MRVEAHTAPSAKQLWKEGATGAALVFLRDTRTGCLVTARTPPEEDEGEGSLSGDGPGPP